MRVIVYGGKGWIGGQFVEILRQNNKEFIVSKVRAENYSDVLNEINEFKPTHLVSFIGRTHGGSFSNIDYLEQKGKVFENVRDNLIGPVNLALISERKKIHYTYLGTGCIFTYLKEHFGQEIAGFGETSFPNFFGSSYSIVKGFTDTMMKNFEDSVLNLRIRMPITDSKNPRNFITKITSYEKICSIPNSMSVLPELLPIVLEMMSQQEKGTFNLTNPGLISHNEILTMYKEIVDPEFTWENFTVEDQREVLDSERSNNFLDTTKLTNKYKIRNIKDGVRDCLIKYKKNSLPRLLVTGGCGFIGSNFINHYFGEKKINKLINLDAMYYCADENNVNENIRNSKDYVLVKGNLKDRNTIKHILNEYEITHIIHFAAQSHVDNSFTDPIKYTEDNILGTHNLLEEVRDYKKIVKFVHVSTDEVYGGLDLETTKDENSLLCPTNPYSATKASAEMIVHSYIYSFNLPVIITRGNNVYGPNQYGEKVIPKFIDLLKNDKKLTIHGSGEYIRDYMFVSDTVKAFELILEKGKLGEIYNIGCENTGISVLELAKILIRKIKKTENFEDWVEYVEDRNFNDKRYLIDNEKLKNLGWVQEINLEDGINKLLS